MRRAHGRFSLLVLASIASALVGLTPRAHAQATASPTVEASATVEAGATPPPPPRAMRGPPPIMVVAIGTERVPPAVTDALRDAIVAQITPMAAGRPVRPLRAPQIEAAISACADPACVGGVIASAGAIEVQIEMLDAASGAPRAAPLVASFAEAADPGASVARLVEQLGAVMFPAPPATAILVTVDVAGAAVSIDEQAIGAAPVEPHEVEVGRHTITVALEGYATVRREIEVALGETAGVELTLVPLVTAPIDVAPIAHEPLWYEHWAFWTGVGGGVVVLAVVIGVAVGVSSSGPSGPMPPSRIELPPLQ